MIALKPQITDELDPIQLRYEFDWTLERLASEIGASVSTVLKWSSGIHKPSKVFRREAYRVWRHYTQS